MSKDRRTNRPRLPGGFTLIELLVVVAIIGIVVAIATPHLLNATDRGRQSGTLGDMRTIMTAVEHYAVDNGGYPAVDTIDELAGLLEPEYMSRVPRDDAWDHRLLYSGEPHAFTLTSLGKDGQQQASPPAGPVRDAAADIIASDGVFVQWPAGRKRMP